MSDKKKFEADVKCEPCKGTGLYVGLAERDGSAVVCYKCKGTGCRHHVFEYEEFTVRSARTGVKHVFQHNPGIVVGQGKDGQYQFSDFGGQPFEGWESGKPFPPGSEMRQFTCPAWWYQAADYKKKPNWDECIGLGSFSKCPHFSTKDQCWARWDEEFGAKD